MAGNADALIFQIIAVNAASPELAKLQKDLQDTAKAVQQHGQTVVTASGAGAKGMKDFSDSIRPVLAATRGMAAEIGGTLNPALGNMVSSLTLVARGAGAMGAAVAGVTAGVLVGAVAFKSYLDSVIAAAEAQAKLNLAVKAFDLASIQSAMLATSAELEAHTERWKTFGGSLANVFRALTDALGFSTSAMAELNAQLAASEKVLPVARLQSVTQALLQQSQAVLQLRGVQLGRAEVLGDEREYLRLITAINQQLSNQSSQEERLLRIKAQQDLGAAEARHALPAEMNLIRERLDRDITTLATRSRASFAALEEQQRRVTMGRFAAELQVAVAGANQAELGFVGVTPDEAARGIKRREAGIERLLALDQARVHVLREQGALTEQQKLDLDLAAIAAERQLKVQQAGLDLDKQALAIFEAEIKTTERQRLHLEKTDPLAGLSAGFRDVEDAFTATGELLRSGIRSVGSDMAQGMSDTFFNVVTGQFTKLSDVSRQFGLNVLRTLTDTLSKAAVGQIFKDFLGNSGLGGGQAFVRGLGVLGAGMSPGGLVEVGGQLFQSVAAGGGQTVLVPMAAGPAGAGGASVAASVAGLGGRAAGGGTGGAGGMLSLFGDMGSAIRAFLNTPLSSVAPSLFGGGAGALAAGGQVAEEAAALGIGGAFSTPAAGATIGSTLGAAAAFVGLAFTIYSGLTGPPTAMNIATGAVSGAVSGAIIGSVIPGIGTVVGAVAGAALGGGAAALGKDAGPKKPSASVRSRQAGQAGGSALSQAVAQAATLEDMAAIFNRQWAPHGEVQILMYPSGQIGVGPLWWAGDWDDAGSHVFIPEDFSNPQHVDGIQVQVGETGIVPVDAQLTQQVKDKIRQINQVLSQIELSTSDLLASPFGGTVQRTTTFRADQAGAFAGQQLFVEGPSLNGLTPEERVAFLKDLAKLDYDLNLNILYRDPATDEIVSISATPFSGDVVRV